MKKIILIISMAFIVNSCGVRGDLYHPDQAQPPSHKKSKKNPDENADPNAIDADDLTKNSANIINSKKQ